MTETTFLFVCPLAGLGFSLTLRHIPLLLGSVLLGRGLIRFYLTSSAPARKAREGVGLVLPLCISISLWLLFHYLLGDTRDRAGGRNVHIQSNAVFSLRVCCLAHWVPFISFLYISPFCMFVKGQSVLIGVKEGDRETVFALGLHPGQRELGHLRSDSAC